MAADEPTPADAPGLMDRVKGALRGPELPERVAPAEAPPLGRGRKIAVWVLIGLAALMLFVSSLTIWVERQVLDTDNWVDTSGQLLEDEAVREATADALVEALFADGRVTDRLQRRLPPEVAPFAPQAAALLQNLAYDAANQLLGLPQTQAVWRDVNRAAHERLVAVLREEDLRRLSVEDGRVYLDLQPLVDRLGARVGVSVTVPAGAAQITVIESEDLSAAQEAVQLLDFLSVFIFLVVLALLVAAFVLAQGHRRVTLRTTGWTWVGVGILVLVARRLVGDALISSVTDASTVDAGEAVWSIGTGLLRDIGWALVVYGLVAVFAAWISGQTRWAVAARGAAAPVVRDRPAVAYGAIAVVFLLILLFGPSGGVQNTLGILVLAILVALGGEVLRRQIIREFPGDGGDAGGAVPPVPRRRSPRARAPTDEAPPRPVGGPR